MKTIILLLSILLSVFSIYSQETIYAEVIGDTVTINHGNVERNCCALYRMDYEFDNPNTINVFEVDIGDGCFCVCYFNLSITIHKLPFGSYTANIYHVNRYEDTTFCGNTTFEVINGYLNTVKFSDYQSECFFLSVKENENLTIVIYPNPFTDYIKIDIEKFQNAKIIIYDISGKEVINTVIRENSLIQTDKLKKGIYLYKVISGDDIYFGKLIKL